MSKRFQKTRIVDKWGGIYDSETDEILKINEITNKLNELAEENRELRQELQKKQEDEQLYANEILELREANKEFIQFKSLGGDY